MSYPDNHLLYTIATVILAAPILLFIKWVIFSKDDEEE